MIAKRILWTIFLIGWAAASSNPRLKHGSFQALLEKTYITLEDTPDDNLGDPLILTPLLQLNKTNEARRLARVDSGHFMGLESYAGYFTVNKTHNGNLWFWYFPVLNKPVNSTPLILWLQGGPGASSLYGLFQEIGPFTVTDDLKLEKKKYSWGDNYSLLFIDNPVGTGFSFTDDGGYAKEQATIGANLYSALQQFMTVFPELRAAPLVIAGESYAGKHVPSLAIQIHWHRQEANINLKGIAIGNGFIDPKTLLCSSPFFREIGLIDEKTSQIMTQLENITVTDIELGLTRKAFEDYMSASAVEQLADILPNPYNFLSESMDFGDNYVKFLEKGEIRKALHVGSHKFQQIGKVYSELIPDLMNSAKPWLEEILDHYKVMLFNGHLDTVVPYQPSRNTYNSLSFSGAAEYKTAEREHWIHNEKLIGYYKKAGNFLEVMVRGAGHMVPVDKPEAAFAIFEKFIKSLNCLSFEFE